MTTEQYNELIQRLDRIIELLYKQSKPIFTGFEHVDADKMRFAVVSTINNPDSQWQGTCRECYLGTCTKEYPHT